MQNYYQIHPIKNILLKIKILCKKKKFKVVISFLLIFILMNLILLIVRTVQSLNFKKIKQDEFLKNKLEIEFNDLNRIKVSLQKELVELEKNRKFLSEELISIENRLNVDIEKFKEIDKKRKVLEGEIRYDEISRLKGINPFGSFSTINSCFLYLKCKQKTKLKIYFFNNTLFDFKNGDGFVFDVVDSIADSCLAINFITNEIDAQEALENLFKIRNDYNLLIINLMDNYNLPIKFYAGMNKNELQYFKCSSYASFNFYSSNYVYNHQFFHFSLIKMNINERVEEIYRDQNQNELLLTFKRKHMLTYYLSNNKEFMEKMRQFNSLNCTIFDRVCIREKEDYFKTLSKSTFLLINNENLTNAMLWTNTLTERLLDAIR
jgi:hypothetical protein